MPSVEKISIPQTESHISSRSAHTQPPMHRSLIQLRLEISQKRDNVDSIDNRPVTAARQTQCRPLRRRFSRVGGYIVYRGSESLIQITQVCFFLHRHKVL